MNEVEARQIFDVVDEGLKGLFNNKQIKISLLVFKLSPIY